MLYFLILYSFFHIGHNNILQKYNIHHLLQQQIQLYFVKIDTNES